MDEVLGLTAVDRLIGLKELKISVREGFEPPTVVLNQVLLNADSGYCDRACGWEVGLAIEALRNMPDEFSACETGNPASIEDLSNRKFLLTSLYGRGDKTI